jgi:hypothetical protein
VLPAPAGMCASASRPPLSESFQTFLEDFLDNDDDVKYKYPGFFLPSVESQRGRDSTMAPGVDSAHTLGREPLAGQAFRYEKARDAKPPGRARVCVARQLAPSRWPTAHLSHRTLAGTERRAQRENCPEWAQATPPVYPAFETLSSPCRVAQIRPFLCPPPRL